MLSFFKSSKKKTQQKGRAFYERENLIQTIDELIEILFLSESDKLLSTKTHIQFHGKELKLINRNNIDDILGGEAYILYPDNNIDGHEVYFYRMKSEHLKFLVQVHFINDNFFLAGTKVYADALLSDHDKQRVVQQIINKYDLKDENSTTFSVQDPEKNIIWTKEDIFFHIGYLFNNNTCKDLKNRYYGLGKPKPGQEIKNTLDNLI